MARPLVAVKNLGRMSYKPAIAIMKAAEKEKLAFAKGCTHKEPMDTLCVVEHNPVYTIGTRTTEYLGPNNTTNESDNEGIDVRLKKLGAEFCVADRGGLITFHGPGQLVCYPVLNLKQYNPSARWYINKLEEVLINTCAEFAVEVGRTADIGVWIEERKIAAIGVHVSKHITSHGLALNCNTDLSWFDNIVPCGIQGKSVTSLSKELGTKVMIQDVLPTLLEKFKDSFNCEFAGSNNSSFQRKELIT